MWNRSDLKYAAKNHMKKNYWPCIAVAFIYTIIQFLVLGGSSSTGVTNYSGDSSFVEDSLVSYIVDYIVEHPMIILGIIGAGIIGFIIGWVIKLLVGYQIEVGVKGFFIKNTYTEPRVGEILETYHNGSMGTVALTRFLMDLFTALWMLLLIIPGIVKSYQYKMIPYILADNPDIEWREAFDLSKQMTDGHKMDLFILDLSFIGWYILSAITCGLVGIFYVIPYKEQTMAEAYETLR